MAKNKKSISAAEFDRKFDAGEDITEYLDLETAIKKVNVDFPIWMVNKLDEEASRLQIPRQAIIKMWIDEKIQQINLDRAEHRAAK
jgi:hypothetical protein